MANDEDGLARPPRAKKCARSVVAPNESRLILCEMQQQHESIQEMLLHIAVLGQEKWVGYWACCAIESSVFSGN